MTGPLYYPATYVPTTRIIIQCMAWYSPPHGAHKIMTYSSVIRAAIYYMTGYKQTGSGPGGQH